jgi:ribonuclease T1
VVFGNRENMLPAKPRGYYHEYTVRTPGVHSRGARRIVCGGEMGTITECYYSDDHYQSFKSIRL